MGAGSEIRKKESRTERTPKRGAPGSARPPPPPAGGLGLGSAEPRSPGQR